MNCSEAHTKEMVLSKVNVEVSIFFGIDIEMFMIKEYVEVSILFDIH